MVTTILPCAVPAARAANPLAACSSGSTLSIWTLSEPAATCSARGPVTSRVGAAITAVPVSPAAVRVSWSGAPVVVATRPPSRSARHRHILGGEAGQIDQGVHAGGVGGQDLVGDRSGGVVEDAVRAQRPQPVDVLARAGREHGGPETGQQLDDVGANPAGGAVDQHRLAALDVDGSDRGDRSGAGQRKRGGGHEVEPGGLDDHRGRWQERVLGQRARLEGRREEHMSEHLVPGRYVYDTRADGLDNAGGVAAEHQRVLMRHHRRQHAGRYGVVERVQPSCFHPNQDLAFSRNRCREVGKGGLLTGSRDVKGKHAKFLRLVGKREGSTRL